MVKKMCIEKLEEGMRICGLAKDDASAAITFVNNMLIRGRNDIETFRSRGYRDAYVVITGTQMHFASLARKKRNS